MSETSEWWKNFYNGASIPSTFGSHAPELCNLELDQFSFEVPDTLSLSLNCGALPETIPEKWRKHGFDEFQLRFRLMEITKLSIAQGAIGASGQVDVVLERQRLHAASKDGEFKLHCAFLSAQLIVFPFKRDIRGASPRWYPEALS